MKKLDFRITEGREGIAAAYNIIRSYGSFNMDSPFFDGDDRFSVIASLNEKDVGFWDGMIGGEDVPFDFGVGGPFFYSKMIYVLEDFRREGFGSQIKYNQLEFAKSVGCESLYCRVEKSAHRDSLSIQKRLGARVRRGGGEYFECCFNLKK